MTGIRSVKGRADMLEMGEVRTSLSMADAVVVSHTMATSLLK
jgi:hypothetical protein